MPTYLGPPAGTAPRRNRVIGIHGSVERDPPRLRAVRPPHLCEPDVTACAAAEAFRDYDLRR
jgi:hypothetical protein